MRLFLDGIPVKLPPGITIQEMDDAYHAAIAPYDRAREDMEKHMLAKEGVGL